MDEIISSNRQASLQHGAVSITIKVIRDHHSTWKKHKRWREHRDVSGNTAKWTTATKRHNEQDDRPDLHPEAHHSHARKTRLRQCEYVVEKICPVQKNHQRH